MFAKNKLFYFTITFVFLIEEIANAYIGPGLALGTIVISLGLVILLIFLIAAILYYPLKRLIIKYKNKDNK